MKHKKIILISLLALTATPASALVVMISDLSPAGAPIEDFFSNNFSNVTEIRHGDFANFSNSQDALNGTGAFAGMGAADVFVIGRSLSSGGYDAGDADGYNGISIPFINMTSYTAREAGNRLGWHTGSAGNTGSRDGAETTLTLAGAALLGAPVGTYDLWTDDPNFNGIGTSTDVGTGDILATLGGNILAAHWDIGDAPGNVTNAGVATFPGVRLLLNIDNEPNAGNSGANDFTGLTPEGLSAYAGVIGATTPLTPVPEPSTGILGLLGAGLMLRRRR
ncbi:MAG: hypothetical protein ACJAQT_003568 [Akkermansiaceae bacterium]|jgi:hypothetical protein